MATPKFLKYFPQPFQTTIGKIYNPPKDGDCGYTYVTWNDVQGREISTTELVKKNDLGELKKDKKMYEIIEYRNID
ncbi:hypothetical protein BY996DRAFT_6554498 [Phakopsora pachyrhizi]|nr:hypothetical protein BY996DRAFT_6554498 [Phakopsora pachyrhizi]